MEKDRRNKKESKRNYVSKVKKWRKYETKRAKNERKRNAGKIIIRKKYEYEASN